MIEILTVASIGLVLVALLVPAVSSVSNKGHQTTCVSNLRQLAAGCVLFGQDNDGRLPYNNDSSVWHSLIYDYIGDDDKWVDTNNLNKNRYYRCKKDKDPYQGKLSYGFNRYFRTSGGRDFRFQTLSRTYPMLAESKNFSFNETDSQPLEYRHRNGANIAFTDGRVEWYKATNVTKEFLEVEVLQ